MTNDQEYQNALRGIHAWVCVKGHCCWDGDYMLVEGGQIIECPVKMMLDSVKFNEYLGLDTMPDNDGKCLYYIEGLEYDQKEKGDKQRKGEV